MTETNEALAEVEADTGQDWFGLTALIGSIVALGVFASWDWAIIVVAIIFMIFMHEMGHYLTARLTGMKVTEFFIGFGPRLWSFRRGETEYGVKAIPAGAYVRIIGMNNLDQVEPGDESRAYRIKSFPRKLLVVSAGSAMHFMMAIVLLFVGILAYGVRSDEGRWAVGSVSDQSAALALEIQLGDELVSIDGTVVEDFVQFGDLIRARGGTEVDVAYLRDGELITQSVILGARLTGVGADAIEGLIERDRILQVEGVDVFGWDDFVLQVEERLGEELTIIVDPAGGLEPIAIEDAVVNSLPTSTEATVGFFGVSQEIFREDLGFFDSATRSITEFSSFTADAAGALGSFFTSGAIGTFVTDTFSGVGNTVEGIDSDVAVDREQASRALDSANPNENRILSIYGAARAGVVFTGNGFEGTLLFMAGLNIFVGLFNLVPLPPLDGGHVAVAVYERIRSIGGRRHQVDYAKLLPLTYVVFVLLISVGMIALFRDIIDPLDLG